MFAFIITCIVYDIGLYAFRRLFGFTLGARDRARKTIDTEPDPTRDPTTPSIPHDDSKKDR